MKHTISFRRVLTVGILCWFCPQACLGQVIINEVFWSGSDLSTADEWVELRNTGTGEVVIGGWSLTSLNSKGQETDLLRFSTGTVMGPNQHMLIANYLVAASRLSREPDQVTTGLSLPNTKLLLRLRDGSGAVMDQADDGVGAPAAGRSENAPWGRASMERMAPVGAGEQSASWITAATFIGFDDGARLYGTPGYSNGSGESQDKMSPQEAEDLRGIVEARGTGAVLRLAWQPSVSLDLFHQELRIEGGGSGVVVVGPTVRSAELAVSESASGYSVRLVSIDDLGNRSVGTTWTLLHESITKNDQKTSLNKGTIRISELLINPMGSDDTEWLELVNTGTGSETLTGYVLTAGSKSVALGALHGTIGSGGYMLLSAKSVGLTLPNAGVAVQLAFSGQLLQQLNVPALPEGIAYGSLGSGGTLQALCSPSPSAPNLVAPPNPLFRLQSGALQGEGKATANVQIIAGSGSLTGAVCSVDYGDGTVIASCNPPSHTIKRVGRSMITATITDYCGSTVIRTLDVEILPQGSAKKRGSMQMAGSLPGAQCQPMAASGVRITEVLSAPAAGSQEWIELRNTTDADIDLCGWRLDDEESGSTPFALDGWRILARAFLVLDRSKTKIAVNDTGDEVRLFAPGSRSTATGTWLSHSGAVLSHSLRVPNARKGEVYAVNDAGIFLWSPVPTPGAANLFPEPLSPIVSQDIDLVVLPNPAGADDEGEEMIGLGVKGTETIDMTGWVLSDASGTSRFTLGLLQLAPDEYVWLKRRETGIGLANERGILRLHDRDHRLVTLLGWRKAGEGQLIHSFLGGERQPIDLQDIRADGTLRVRPFVQRRSQLLATPDETVELFGFDPAQSQWVHLLDHERSSPHWEKKQYEYYSRSDYGSYSGSLLFLKDGELALFRYLRLGLSTVTSEAEQTPLGETLLAYEAEARQARRGLWADEAFVRSAEAKRQEDVWREVLRVDGLQLRLHPEPGLLPMTGGLVTVRSNIPADIRISSGSGASVVSTGGILLDTDAQILATAEVRIGDEVFTTSATGAYVLRRKDYRGTLVLSEVYPAPGKAMDAALGDWNQEWVEIRNLTNEAQSVAGWQLDDVLDGGSKPRYLPPSLVVPPGGYLAVAMAPLKISLSNSGDSVYLQDPNGNTEHIMYSKIATTKSVVAHSNYSCQSDVPTPGRAGGCVTLRKGKDVVDVDGDLLPDDAEQHLYGTDPSSPDSDGNGWPDGFEVFLRTQSGASASGVYDEYLLTHLKPKWRMTKTKGLVLDLRNGPIRAAEYRVEGASIGGQFTRRKSGSWEASIVGQLGSGTYAVTVMISDIVNTKVELKNALQIHINGNYAYSERLRKSSVKSSPALFSYALVDDEREKSSVLRTLAGQRRVHVPVDGLLPFLVGTGALVILFCAAWYTRKQWLSD